MKLSLRILGVMLTCLFAVFMVGCDPDPVYITSVSPPEGGRLEPGFHVIDVTFDGEPEGLKADGGAPAYEEIPFEFAGNTATFHQSVELGGSIGIFLTWENIDKYYDSPYTYSGAYFGGIANRDEKRYISFYCKSDAVVSFANADDVRGVPPWPNFANVGSGGSSSVDTLQLEVPIYIDKVLAYDLPIIFDRYELYLTKYPGTVLSREYMEEGRLSPQCVIEKGSTKSVCTIEIPTGIEKDHKDYKFNYLNLYLKPIRVPYTVNKERLVIKNW